MSTRESSAATLYNTEKTRLRRIVERIVGNSSTAEELVHDAFSNLLKAADVNDARAYLTRAARNLALNHLRHLRHGVEVSTDEQIYNAIADQRPSPEVEVVYRQELRRLLNALASLPPRRREIFILHRFEDATYSEISERLDLSRRTVINHVVNALDDLYLALGPDFAKFA
jgi:RNA polymerase sigma factor (sigma-70 family)